MKRPFLHIARAQARREGGAVAIIFGLTIAVLVGFVGLALDLGRFFVIKAELQNAMDACALAAASQLRPGRNDPNALRRAVAYGRVFTTGGVSAGSWTGNNPAIQNMANFQDEVVNAQPAHVAFSATLAGDYKTLSQAAGTKLYNEAKYARCSYPREGLPVLFMKVLNLMPGTSIPDTQTVSAMAVATLGSETCNVLPVGICAPGGKPENLKMGNWIPLKKANDPNLPGWFSWLDYDAQAGGASELLDRLTQEGQCDLPPELTFTQQGKETSVQAGWNSRFGLDDQGSKSSKLIPDFTGYSYFNHKTKAVGKNGVSDYYEWTNLQREDNSTEPRAYNGENLTDPAGNPIPNFQTAQSEYRAYEQTTDILSKPTTILTCQNKPSQDSPEDTNLCDNPCDLGCNGRPDRRLAIVPIMNCTADENVEGKKKSVIGLACTLMLNPFGKSTGPGDVIEGKLEYLGQLDVDTTPCGTATQSGPLMSVLVK